MPRKARDVAHAVVLKAYIIATGIAAARGTLTITGITQPTRLVVQERIAMVHIVTTLPEKHLSMGATPLKDAS